MFFRRKKKIEQTLFYTIDSLSVDTITNIWLPVNRYKDLSCRFKNIYDYIIYLVSITNYMVNDKPIDTSMANVVSADIKLNRFILDQEGNYPVDNGALIERFKQACIDFDNEFRRLTLVKDKSTTQNFNYRICKDIHEEMVDIVNVLKDVGENNE